jgi:hypothetical protein
MIYIIHVYLIYNIYIVLYRMTLASVSRNGCHQNRALLAGLLINNSSNSRQQMH